MTDLILPARHLVPSFAPAPGDHLTDLIYGPVTGLVYRRRFRMALDAVARTGRAARLLEVGCGAGLLLPSLARVSDEVHAVDIHGQVPAVQRMVDQLALGNVHVQAGSVLELPFSDGRFTHVVCLSVLEHLREVEIAARELVRVASAGGCIVIGFPTKNLITKALFRLVGYCDDDIHPSSHRDILRAAAASMTLDEIELFPPRLPLDMSLYVVARLRARGLAVV